MKIDELIARLNELADCSEIWGTVRDGETVSCAAETIQLLWEIAQDSSNAKYRRKIDGLMGDNNDAG